MASLPPSESSDQMNTRGVKARIGQLFTRLAAVVVAVLAIFALLFMTHRHLDTERSADEGPKLAHLPFQRERLTFIRVGEIAVYRPQRPQAVVIMLSGDGGWGGLVDALATRLARSGTLVLGVDTPAYLRLMRRSKAQCYPLSGELQMLAQFAEQRLGLQQYQAPVVIGYSAGATLAYLAAVPAPSVVAGGIALSFPPDVLGTGRPICLPGGVARAIDDGFLYSPVAPAVPVTILQGSDDAVVPPGQARNFTRRVSNIDYQELAGVDHGFANIDGWFPRLQRALVQMTGNWPGAAHRLAALPLTEVPALPAENPVADRFAIFLSGDGGWADLDSQVADGLAARGLPVVGWSSLRYFWDARTPEVAARDLDSVIQTYARLWKRRKVVLIGYSFGADALPAIIARLPPASRERVVGFVSIAGSPTASFQFSTLDWFRRSPAPGPAVAPVVASLGMPVLCIQGADDGNSLCPLLGSEVASRVTLPGGHHFGGRFSALVPPIMALAAAPQAGRASTAR